jgi:hypothetical protein
MGVFVNMLRRTKGILTMLRTAANTITRPDLLNPVPDFIPADVIKEVIDSIIRKQFEIFRGLLRNFPLLLNYPLNADKQTPLILATIHGARIISEFLIDVGADSSHIDEKNLAVLDYANFHEADHLIEKIGIQTTLNPHFTNLIAAINNSLQEEAITVLKQEILEMTRVFLQNYLNESSSDAPFARQIDLLYTAQGIYEAVATTRANDVIITNLREFFALREHVLRGDEHDYFFNQTLANRLSVAVAKIIAPTVTPLNFLLRNALTADRRKSWASGLNDTLENSHDFFRNRDDEIHDYYSILDKAKGLLILSDNNPEHIWLCLDEKNISQEAVGRSVYKPLSRTDLEIVKQRSKSFKKLVERTEAVHFYIQSKPALYNGSIIVKLNELRHSLLLGDKSAKAAELLKELSLNPEQYKAYRGTEKLAGGLAHMGVYQFWCWWQQLGNPYEKTLNLKDRRESGLQKRIRAVSSVINKGEINERKISLNDIFCMLWQSPDPDYMLQGVDSLNITLCAELNGSHLETILNDPVAKKQLLELCKEEQWQISHEDIADFETAIIEELTQPATSFNLPSVFKEITPYVIQLDEKTRSTLDYQLFDNITPEIFSPLCSANDLLLLQNIDPNELPLFFSLIFQHPELIDINPKLSLFTAIMYHTYDEPGNAFFGALTKNINKENFINAAINIMERAFELAMPDYIIALFNLGFSAPQLCKAFLNDAVLSENTETGKKVLSECDSIVNQNIFLVEKKSVGQWRFLLAYWFEQGNDKISETIYSELFSYILDNKNWKLMWECLAVIEPKNIAVIDIFVQTLVATDQLLEISTWRQRASSSEANIYRHAISRFWETAITKKGMLTQTSIRIFTHENFPEVKNILLSANTPQAWENVKEYVKDRVWGSFDDAFVNTLLLRALKFDPRLANDLVLTLMPLFEMRSTPEQKPLVKKLLRYCKTRQKEQTDSGYHRFSLWGRWKGMHEKVKLSAAIKAILTTRCEVQLTPDEKTALNDSRLGWIMYWNNGKIPNVAARPMLGR